MTGRTGGHYGARGLIARAITAALSLAITAAMGVTAGTAAADVRIVSPRDDALTTTSVVTAEVRLSGRVNGFRAYLRGRDFSDVRARFGPARHGVRTALLRVGRELVVGRNHLFVEVRGARGRRQLASSHFTVGRARRAFLRLRGVRGGTTRAPIALRAAARRGAALRATLNGRSIARVFREGRAGRWRADLAAQDGLRFGRNRLTVTAFDEQTGAYGRIRRTFRIRRAQPLIGAGRDRVARRRLLVRLDGRSTRASRPGRVLRMRWRIVKRPKGSKAKLRQARSARPLLRPDVRGRYTIRLRASERGRRGPTASAAPSATDTVEVAAQPAMLPAGIQVTTLASADNPGIQVGGAFYRLGGWAQMLVLDRTTLEPVGSDANKSYPGTAAGMSQLQQDAAKLTSSELAILSGSGVPAPIGADGQGTLAGVVTSLGGTFEPGAANAADLATGQWSMIGITGLPQGAAHQSIGVADGSGRPPGSMNGFFQLDTKNEFTFTWPPTFQTFDTGAPGTSAAQNVIALGSETYTSAPIPSNIRGGFHVLWLDAGNLTVKGEYTVPNQFRTSLGGACPPSPALTCLDVFAGQTLPAIIDAPGTALIVVASFGKPAAYNAGAVLDPGNTSWAAMTQELNGFGAQPAVFLGLNGSGDYSFLGTEGSLQADGPNSGTELGQSQTGAASARLAGLFERDRQGNWAPAVNGSPQPPALALPLYQPSLQQLLAQDPQAFEPFDTVVEQAAEAYINNKLGFGQLDPVNGIRALYWGDDSIAWDTAQNTLQNMTPCRLFPCSDGFRRVKNILLPEFGDVNTVRQYMGGPNSELYSLLQTAFITGSVTFDGISSDIQKAYDLPPVQPQGTDPLAIVDDVLTIASGATGAIPEVGGVASGFLTITVGMNQLIADLTNGGGGAPALDTATFQGDVAGWSDALTKGWTQALDGVGATADLLVSDAGRLSAAADYVNNPDGSTGGWGTSTQAEDLLIAQLQENLTSYMWSTMLPVAAQVALCDRYPRNPGQGFPPVVSQGVMEPWLVAFANLGPDSYYYAIQDYAFPILVTEEQAGRFLDADTLDTLFSADNLGLDPFYFLAGAWTNAQGNATTPGFVWIPNQVTTLQFIYYGCSGQGN
jgi:hypothetical protein